MPHTASHHNHEETHRREDGYQPEPADPKEKASIEAAHNAHGGDLPPPPTPPEGSAAADDGGEEPSKPITRDGNNVRASWRFSLQDIRANMAHCSPAGKQAMVDLFLWSIDPKHPIHLEEAASRLQYDSSTLTRIYNGKYTNPRDKTKRLDVPEKLVRAIKTLLRIEKERAAGGKNEFVMTPTARRVQLGCDLARESQSPVFITSPSHIGKTWALENYSQTNNHGRSPYFRMKAASGLGGMVRSLCRPLGISDKGNTANLIDYIKNGVTSDMVLLLDELHLLQYTYRLSSFFACMEVIREIYDETKCGMVLSGTTLFLEKLKAGAHKEMEQLLRRGVHRIPLPDYPTVPDLTAIFNHSGLEFPTKSLLVTVEGVTEKPYDILRQLSRDNGLKSITERLRYARKRATRSGEPLTWDHFVNAHLTIVKNGLKDPNDDQGGWE